jgi:hypothetical protein
VGTDLSEKKMEMMDSFAGANRHLYISDVLRQTPERLKVADLTNSLVVLVLLGKGLIVVLSQLVSATPAHN